MAKYIIFLPAFLIISYMSKNIQVNFKLIEVLFNFSTAAVECGNAILRVKRGDLAIKF